MKKFVLISLALAAAVAGGFLAFRFYLSPKSLSLEQLKWENAPPIVAFNDVKRTDLSGLLFLRLKDGKEQFIAGGWHAFFRSPSDVLSLGEFPLGYSSSTGQYLYILDGGERLYGVSLDRFKERVSSVRLNQNNAYLLFKTQNDGTIGFCVAEWQKIVHPDCKPIRVSEMRKAMWDPASDHTAVVQTATGTLYRADPWNNGMEHPQMIDPDKEAVQIATLNKLFSEPVKSDSDGTAILKPQIVWRFLDFVVIREHKTWSVLRPPQGSSLAWLDDGEHLLVTQADRLSVYEIKTRSIATLISDKDIGTKTLSSYRNKSQTAL